MNVRPAADCQECLRLRRKIKVLRSIRDILHWNKQLDLHIQSGHTTEGKPA